MSADLHIHAFAEGTLTENDFRDMFCHTMGSKYFDLGRRDDFDKLLALKDDEDSEVWVGEVSWLKAALSDDADTFIPSAVQAVNDLVGEDHPLIDDALIDKICKAMDVENPTGYSVASVDSISDWLGRHKGQRAFTVSW